MKTRRVKCVQIVCSAIIFLASAIACTGQATGSQTNEARQSANPSGQITGEWQGNISKLRLALHLEQPTGADLKGNLVSLDQGNVTIPIEVATFGPGGALRLDL